MKLDNKAVIATDRAPAAIGPYSQGMAVGDMVFTSGQISLDPVSGLIPAGIREQTEGCLRNVQAVLTAGGCALSDVVKITVFCTDLKDFSAINEVYGSFFEPGKAPARSCVQVSALPKGAMIEIEAVAVKNPRTVAL